MKQWQINLTDLSREDAFLLLNGIGKLGPVSVRKLLLAHENDPCRILGASRSSLLSVDGVGQAMIDSIKSSENEKWLKNEKLKLKNGGYFHDRKLFSRAIKANL